MGRGERTSACAHARAALIYGRGGREGAVGRPRQVRLWGRTPREEQDPRDAQTQHRGPAAEASPALEGTWATQASTHSGRDRHGAQLPTWGAWAMCSGTRRWGSKFPATWISHLLHSAGHSPDPRALWWCWGSGFHLPGRAARRGPGSRRLPPARAGICSFFYPEAPLSITPASPHVPVHRALLVAHPSTTVPRTLCCRPSGFRDGRTQARGHGTGVTPRGQAPAHGLTAGGSGEPAARGRGEGAGATSCAAPVVFSLLCS